LILRKVSLVTREELLFYLLQSLGENYSLEHLKEQSLNGQVGTVESQLDLKELERRIRSGLLNSMDKI